ncbi:MAG: Asp-tRNA(Asn)/Glu-tRNA(Gln) amidotransferase subunit GatA [Epulopiscium sp.]|nr:Asp-tRNA(Asn)/Glu-tRNA(Gln) amidotransferase subunit GatA [Candidatus Epulonipiscium sp.]
MHLFTKTADELATMLRNKEVTSVELIEAYFERIEAVDDKVKAYISLDKEGALEKAEEIDAKLEKGEELSRLAGIPIGIKDNICTKGLKTTCASRMLEDFIPPYSATVVEKLEDAGAIIIGKLNMDEFAMGGSTENSYFFPSHNPWDLERGPGGSSGGSAAAVAAGESVFSIGTDTGGSIRQPASSCNLVGLKPSKGLVSNYGVVSYASSFDQTSPITKDVKDMALVLNAITGHDPKDSTSINMEYPDYTKALTEDVKGLRIALPKEYFGEGFNQEVKEAVLASTKKLEDMGAVVEEISMPLIKHSLPAYYIIACAEASSNLARLDGVAYGHRAKDYTDVESLYSNSRGEGFGAEVKRRIILGTFVLSAANYDSYYKKALETAKLIKEEHNKVLEDYDVIIAPTMPTTALKIGQKQEDPVKDYLNDICTINANIAGVPAMSLPCGFDKDGLPIGMQLIAGEFKEETILRVAYTLEQATDFKDQRPKL